MEEWLKYALTAAGSGGLCTVLGLVLGFALKWRKQNASDFQMLFQQAFARVTALEVQTARLQDEHIKCLQSHAASQAELNLLKTVTLTMHKDNLSVLNGILSEMKADRQEMAKQQGAIMDHLSDVWGVVKEIKT
jgi:hypothetical protein